MQETRLEIKENEKNGTTYYNLEFKQKFKVVSGKKETTNEGIPHEGFAIIEKRFAEGREIQTKFGVSYLCGGVYDGKDVSFFLNEKDHEKFKNVGGVGDKLRVRMTKEPFVMKNGAELLKQTLDFDLME